VKLKLELVDDPAQACAAVLLAAVSAGGNVVLTGGSTPRAAYERLARELSAAGTDISRTTFWFGDERCVPPDDDRSNFKMAKESLLDALTGVAPPQVRRMQGELGPEQGAADYERQLGEAGPPVFDLILLGIGSDGHTASLFPDQDSLSERSRLVVGVPEAGLEPFVPRISLTLNALAAARRVVFLVSGAGKADAVAAAFGADSIPDPRVPASVLARLAGDVTVLLDGDAAAGLGLARSG
jgi:6-phosphogluconolactonase